jgi:hypothetical protein
MMAKTSRLFKDEVKGVLAKIESPGASKYTAAFSQHFQGAIYRVLVVVKVSKDVNAQDPSEHATC